MDNEKFQELVLAQFEKMNSRFDSLESQVKENTQILKTLEHLTEVNKADHDKTSFILSRMESKMSTSDEKIEQYFTNRQFHIVAAANE